VSRYLVQVPRDSLSESRKAAIADAIASAHRAIPGANAHTLQIAITEIDAGCFFSDGRLIECDHIFVHDYSPAVRGTDATKPGSRAAGPASASRACRLLGRRSSGV
jgi:phenylpyruvate tautomerase PptA (4-oxalocrotonate tautomerase family)